MKGGFGGGGYDEKARQEVAVQEQLQRQREITQNGVLTAKKLGYTAVDSASKALGEHLGGPCGDGRGAGGADAGGA